MFVHICSASVRNPFTPRWSGRPDLLEGVGVAIELRAFSVLADVAVEPFPLMFLKLDFSICIFDIEFE
jgi:hypothetical protein